MVKINVTTVAFYVSLIALAIHLVRPAMGQDKPKELYLPTRIWHVPPGNDFAHPDSEYAHARKVESENIAVFWAKEYGADPKTHEIASKRFDPEAILRESERYYQHYRDTVKMVEAGKSLSDQYKLLFFVIPGEEGTAFGGGAADSVGVMWASSLRVQHAPYGAVAHEMAHCFQYITKCDHHWAYSTSVEGSRGHSIFEMAAQYMLWQVYPEWMTFENYHLQSFMGKTHYAFLHETNMYHSPYVFEYWSGLHGRDFHGRLWRESREGEDAVMTYKRLVGRSQADFNDELFDGYRRFITWDLPRVRAFALPYANQHKTPLNEKEGWYHIPASHAPQHYGYNGIPLVVPSSDTNVVLLFEGLAGTADYRDVDVDNAGWRYGFVAMTTSGQRIYGDIGRSSKGELTFQIPDETKHLWLVISGAPQEHRIHLLDNNEDNDEQWGYRFQVRGTRVGPLVD